MSDIATLEDARVDEWTLIVRELMKRPDFSIDQLERILALRNQERRDRAQHEFNTAFAKCQAEVTKAPSDKPNPLFKSRYSSLEAMYDAVYPAVVNHGFSWKVSAIGTPEGYEPALWFRGTITKGIISDSVEWPVHPSALVPEGGKGGRPAMTHMQASGALATYMRKYLIGLMFQVITAEDVRVDNDGNKQPPKPTLREWLDAFKRDCEAASTQEAGTEILQREEVLRAATEFKGQSAAVFAETRQKMVDRLWPAPTDDKPADKPEDKPQEPLDDEIPF